MLLRQARYAFLVILVIGFAFSAYVFTNVRAAVATEHTLPADPFGTYLIPSGSHVRGASEMASIGAQWASLYLSWRSVETSPGVYNWSAWDQVLADAAAHDLQIILTVGENPGWAAATSCGPIRTQHLSAFADFLTAAVQRYSVPPYNVLHWSLYNEPDNSNAVDYLWVGAAGETPRIRKGRPAPVATPMRKC